LIIKEGSTVTINLKNELSVPVSLVFPGMSNTSASGAIAEIKKGLLTTEALPGGSVTYTFTATKPGTYTYYSGTEPDLQVEMGIVGAIIVRPSDYVLGDTSTYSAYGGGSTSDTGYDREYLFLLTEMDPVLHSQVELGFLDRVDTTKWWSTYWFINGRTAPDTMDMPYVGWLPTQPYNAMVQLHPRDRVLMRLIGGGRDLHPFHTHGNHTRIIAIDGRPLESVPDSGDVDISEMAFTMTIAPGSTTDAIFIWTGYNLGWDFYGHGWDPETQTFKYASRDDCILNEPYIPGECPDDNNLNDPACDHCKAFPVEMPPTQDLGFSPFYSGSPFLGGGGFLPPGTGGFNPNGGFFYMWHSHNENEIVNNNLFPGGMFTMIVVEHPDVELPAE
jgi:hypothetical protein